MTITLVNAYLVSHVTCLWLSCDASPGTRVGDGTKRLKNKFATTAHCLGRKRRHAGNFYYLCDQIRTLVSLECYQGMSWNVDAKRRHSIRHLGRVAQIIGPIYIIILLLIVKLFHSEYLLPNFLHQAIDLVLATRCLVGVKTIGRTCVHYSSCVSL